ncbi:MAG: DUF1186 domain-containing protein [Burkholderiales bacterium]
MDEPRPITADVIVRTLEYNSGVFPADVMREAVAQRVVITPLLLAALGRTADAPRELLDDPAPYMLHLYAMYLLAQFRERRALDPLIRLFSLPGDTTDNLTGDVVTEDLPAILASTCGGDTAPIKALIENREADVYARDAGIRALLTLVAEGALERDELIDYLRAVHGNLGADEWQLCTFWVAAADALYPEELMPEIHAVFKAGLVDPSYITLDIVERTLSEGRERTLARLGETQRYLVDAIDAMSDWACFRPDAGKPTAGNDDDGYDDMDDEHPVPDTYRREMPRIGRNDPCPCGSGKKYKKCCMVRD